MRTLRTILPLALILAVFTTVGWAQTNAHKSAIVNSAHDLSSTNTGYSWSAASSTLAGGSAVITNLCYFCHITHKAGTPASVATQPGYMLWNHTISSVTSYGYYGSDTFNALLTAGGGTINDLGNTNSITSLTVSNLCLSCHDGSIAIASFYETTGGLPAAGSYLNNAYGSFTNISGGNPFQITDLSKSHPVNFTYTSGVATAAGGQLLSPAIGSVDGNGALPLYGASGTIMQCTTCHDPHNGTFLTVTEPGATRPTTVFPFPRLFLSSYTGTGGFCCYCHT